MPQLLLSITFTFKIHLRPLCRDQLGVEIVAWEFDLTISILERLKALISALENRYYKNNRNRVADTNTLQDNPPDRQFNY